MSPPNPSMSPKEIVEQWLRRKHIDDIPSTHQLHEGVIFGLLKVVSVEPGFVVCSFRTPSYLTNSSQTLHEGVIASIVDNVGAAVLVAIDGKIRVSVELNVSYISPAHIDDEIVVEAKILNFGVPIAVVVVDLKNKNSGKLIAHGRHTMYRTAGKL